MALCEIHRPSDALQKQVGLNVLLPEVGKPPYPVFYLLHGLSDDYTGWLRRSRIEVYVREYPMIVVMPDGFRGWYTKHDNGPDYAHYIAVETVNYIDQFFPTKHTRDARCIGGLSMGGYGALRQGLGFPDRFCSITSHSGAVFPWKREPAVLPAYEQNTIFGPSPEGTDHDLLHLAQTAKHANELPAIHFDCGTEDSPWIEHNRTLHSELGRMRVPHEYSDFPGAHDWDYWDLRIREAIEFHAKQMKAARIPVA